MSAAKISFRRGVAADAATLSAFAARVFRDWYLPDNAAEDIALHLAATFTPSLQAAELTEPRLTYLLAQADGQLAGYALLRRDCPHPLVVGQNPWAMERFYLDRQWHGSGVALDMMAAAAAMARANGAGTLWLTAWEKNPRAQAFYAKAGFEDVGTDTFLLGRSLQVDRLLVRALD
ncbi:MAG: GNAT family N-acetyltransferase [Proteobacteria bacterium]|nr:GNAT family N-acetyltransferase [Pseudomonadota bacterium]